MVVDLLLPLSDLRLPARPFLDLLALEVGVRARVGGQSFVVDVEDLAADIVEEPVVMGDDEDDALELAQELLEPADREDVQVVGRLVEQQGVRSGRQGLRQQHAELEAAGEGRERLPVDFCSDPQPFQDLGRSGLQGVAVPAHDDFLQRGVAVAVEVLVGSLQQPVLLDHRVPQLRVAHHDDVEDPILLVLEVVLPEHPQPAALRDRDRAFTGRLVARQHAQQRRLARPVRTHEAVAFALREAHARAREQGLLAEALAEVRDGDHGLVCVVETFGLCRFPVSRQMPAGTAAHPVCGGAVRRWPSRGQDSNG